jgi:hypothetical protein
MNTIEKIKKEVKEKKKEADNAYARSDLNRLEGNKRLEIHYKKLGDKLTQDAINLLKRIKILEKSAEQQRNIAHNLDRASHDPKFREELRKSLTQTRKSRGSTSSSRSGTIKRGKEKMPTQGIKLEELSSREPPSEIIADLTPAELEELQELELELEKQKKLTPDEKELQELELEKQKKLTPDERELQELELELEELENLEKEEGGPSETSEADKLLRQGFNFREMMDDSERRLQETNRMLEKNKQEIYKLNEQAKKLSKETGIPYDDKAVLNELERRSTTTELQVCSPRPLGRPPLDNLTRLKLYIKSLLASIGCSMGGERKTRKYKKYKNKTKKYKKDKKDKIHKRHKRDKKHTNKYYKKHKKHKRYTKKN